MNSVVSEQEHVTKTLTDKPVYQLHVEPNT